VIREAFSMHIVLCFFTQADRYQIDGELNQIASDNLQEIVKEAKQVLEHNMFRDLVSQASGCPKDTVRTAVDCQAKERDQILALDQVYQGLLGRLPKREYTCENTQEDLAGYDDDDQFEL